MLPGPRVDVDLVASKTDNRQQLIIANGQVKGKNLFIQREAELFWELASLQVRARG